MWAERLVWNGRQGWLGNHTRETRPQLVLVFGETDIFKEAEPHRQLRSLFPDAVTLGCSTGTIVLGDQISDTGMTALAIGFDHTRVRLATVEISSSDQSRTVGTTIGAQLAGDELSCVFILSDGLNINGSELVAGLVEIVGDTALLSGGLAGDGGRFGETLVSVNGVAASRVVAAVGLYGRALRIGHGSAGGWDSFGPKRKITRSQGNVLFELDGRPALDLYEHYLGDEAAALPASALYYPLRVWDPEHPSNDVVRTVLSIDRDKRSMIFAGNVPDGWSAQLMQGSNERLINGAAQAAQQARDILASKNADPSVCLFVSCVGRRLLMGQRAVDELEAVAEILGPDVLHAGFYSYGEIAPQGTSGLCNLHNQTVTLTLLSELTAEI